MKGNSFKNTLEEERDDVVKDKSNTGGRAVKGLQNENKKAHVMKHGNLGSCLYLCMQEGWNLIVTEYCNRREVASAAAV